MNTCARPRTLAILAVLACSFTATDAAWPVDVAERVAVWPVDDRSGAPGAAPRLRAAVRDTLDRLGVATVDENSTDAFLRSQRVRWVGGIGRDLAEDLRQDTGATGVLIVSLDTWEDGPSPQVAFQARLVSTTRPPQIAWVEAFHRNGFENHGLFGRRMTDDVEVVLDRATQDLERSLRRFLSGRRQESPPWDHQERFEPISYHGTSTSIRFGPRQPRRIAVLPLIDDTGGGRAGEVLASMLVRHLAYPGTVEVLEPGVVREALLEARVIQHGGLSLSQSDALRALLDVDVVVTGRVAEFQPATGSLSVPRIGFSLIVIETSRRQAVWTSFHYDTGDESVVFFDARRIEHGDRLAFEATRAAVATMTRWTPRKIRKRRELLWQAMDGR